MRLRKVEFAADALGVTVQRVYDLARQAGFFPAGVVVRIGRQVRFNEDALHDWIRSGGSALTGGSVESSGGEEGSE
jgi:excisionase family DNA binding protein